MLSRINIHNSFGGRRKIAGDEDAHPIHSLLFVDQFLQIICQFAMPQGLEDDEYFNFGIL